MKKNGMKILGCLLLSCLLASCAELESMAEKIKNGNAVWNYDLEGTTWETSEVTTILTTTTTIYTDATGATVKETHEVETPLANKITRVVFDKKAIGEKEATFSIITWTEVATNIAEFTDLPIDPATFTKTEYSISAGEIANQRITTDMTYNFMQGQKVGVNEIIKTGKWSSAKNKIGELIYDFTYAENKTTTYDYTLAIVLAGTTALDFSTTFTPENVTSTIETVSIAEGTYMAPDYGDYRNNYNFYNVFKKAEKTILSMSDSSEHLNFKLIDSNPLELVK